MIKVGDKVLFEGTTYKVHSFEQGDIVFIVNDEEMAAVNEKHLYADLYNQQKQRANQYEKRWTELKQQLTETYKYLNKMHDAWKHDEMESSLWNAGSHEVLMALNKMDELEGNE